jgi:ligand-binding sensor domain-containing protein
MYFDTTTNFLWLATQAGLVRYDGANTKVFDLRDLPSLKTIRIWQLFPTVAGEVLVSNTSHEIFPIKNNLPINRAGYTSYSNYYNTNARSLADLNLEAKIANRYTEKFSPLNYSAWVNDSTWTGLSKTHIGVFNNEQLLHYWPTKKDVTALIVRNGFIYALNKDASGYCINLNNKTLLNTTLTDNVLRRGKLVFFYDKLNDQPLLLNNDNLYEISLNKNIISAKFVALLKNLPSEITSVIMHPNKKFVFVSTNTSGVHIYRLSPFRVYKSLVNDGNNISSDINNNYATVLTDSNHIFNSHSLLFDLTSGSSKKVIPSNVYFRNLGLDSSKNLWLPTGSVVSRFHIQEPGKINRYPIKNGNVPITFYLAKSGKFWVSTSKFLGYDDHKNVRELISYGTDGDSSSFFYLAETMDGRLVGANKRGIYLINTLSKKLTRVLSGDQVSEVRNIHIDSSDVVWITTYGKGIFLYKLKEAKLFKLPVDDKGYLLYSHAFIDDGFNNFLVPTNKGLFRLSRNNLLQIYATPSTPLLYQYFDVSEGLLTNEFNGGCQPAFNRLPNR